MTEDKDAEIARLSAELEELKAEMNTAYRIVADAKAREALAYETVAELRAGNTPAYDPERLARLSSAAHDDVRAAETRGWNAAIEMAAATLEIGQRQPASAIRALAYVYYSRNDALRGNYLTQDEARVMAQEIARLSKRKKPATGSEPEAGRT